ncbi:TetR family transcriptional regulator [Streptomyces sp. NBC_01803]|uniref:TetR family transcriptional regulator n=1 Tax=Streptomyces sp. NBC_01803 TaxID=2975946 RepID=UPI002DDA88B2|nr:TetR family transcriptional regulator [Streptomyces sp. NBC_01803]WSA44799.1 TetR family transcriptional regulator [Streptomyces sp. NBC_01803]
MPYDAAATRARIMEAATAEFAERGIDGARVDRIAERAGANKASIYSYFGNKEQLFAAVLERQMGELIEAIHIRPERVPEFAGELFDHYRAHPELLKLLLNEAQFYGAKHSSEDPVRIAHYQVKTDALAAGQRSGHITADLPPAHLLMLLIGTVAWYYAVPQVAAALLGDGDDPEVVAAYRASAVEAVRRIITPLPAEGATEPRARS